MNRRLLVLLGVTLILGLALIAEAGAATSSGYVTYSVHVSSNGSQQSFSVNESVSLNSNQGESVLSLVVKSVSTNFTYSHLINSSLMLFPYVLTIANQSFTYSNDSYSITARTIQNGSSPLTFEGKAYTLNEYAFYANFTKEESSEVASGKLATFPSGLVYSIALLSNGTLATATLTSTSLPLQASSASPNLQAASVGVGVSVAGAAVALSLGVRARRKNGPQAGPKPDHWVD